MRQILLAMSTIVLTVAWVLVFVNTVIAEKHVSLDSVASKELIDENAELNGRSGREQLNLHIETLRHLTPRPRIDVRLATTGDRMVVAHVELKSPDRSSMFGAVPSQSSTLWPVFEILRISGGRVVERTYDSTGLVGWMVPRGETVSFPIPKLRVFTVNRWTIQRSSTSQFVSGEPPAIFLIESGPLEMSLLTSFSDPITIYRSNLDTRLSDLQTVKVGDSVELQGGELVMLPPGAAISLQNPGAETATAFQLAFNVPMDVIGLNQIVNATTDSERNQDTPLLFSAPTYVFESTSRLHVGLLEMSQLGTVNIDADAELLFVLPLSDTIAVRSAQQTPSSFPPAFVDSLQVYSWDSIEVGLQVLNTGAEPAMVWFVVIR